MKTTTRRGVAGALALLPAFGIGSARAQAGVTAAEARAIAKEAYIYGYPMVDGYRINYAFWLLPGNPEYKAPLNTLVSLARLFTPADTAVQTPNSDTPYSFFGADIRAEPIVLTVPEIEKERYYSIQLVDAYTHNFAYIGSRATGNGAGNYLVTGPGWKGEKPPGITAVIPCETDLMLGIYRTQLFNPGDMEAVKKVQAGYRMRPLSAFLGKAAPPAPPKVDYIRPYAPAAQKTSLEMFKVLNFVLTFCPHRAVGDGADGAVRQDRRRRGQGVRRRQAAAGDQAGHRGGRRRRVEDVRRLQARRGRHR